MPKELDNAPEHSEMHSYQKYTIASSLVGRGGITLVRINKLYKMDCPCFQKVCVCGGGGGRGGGTLPAQ